MRQFPLWTFKMKFRPGKLWRVGVGLRSFLPGINVLRLQVLPLLVLLLLLLHVMLLLSQPRTNLTLLRDAFLHFPCLPSQGLGPSHHNHHSHHNPPPTQVISSQPTRAEQPVTVVSPRCCVFLFFLINFLFASEQHVLCFCSIFLSSAREV